MRQATWRRITEAVSQLANMTLPARCTDDRNLFPQPDRSGLTLLATVGSLFLRTNSVFRLAARRTGLGWPALEPEAAPVSEKRVGLNRSPGPGYGR
jgi:hypothetical protein